MADEPDEDLFVPAADEADQPDNPDTDPPAEDEGDDFQITLEGEDGAPTDTESDQFRDLRRAHRAQVQENAQLRALLAPKPKELGPRPTLDEHAYNQETYDEALLKWHADKREVDEAETKRTKDAETHQQAWQQELQTYERKKAALPVRDFARAEEAASAALTPHQLQVIVKAADDPAKVIYALGTRATRLAEIAKITDLVKFTAAVVKLEGTITVNTRKPPPEPEARVRGAAPFTAANADKHMAKLEAEAEKTGDRTAIRKYRQQLAERQTKRAG